MIKTFRSAITDTRAIALSIIMMSLSIIVTLTVDSNKGIEFGGGYAINFSTIEAIELSDIASSKLVSQEIQVNRTVLKFKSDLPKSEIELIKDNYANVILSIESISASYGQELITDSIKATAIAFLVVAIYTAAIHNSVMALSVLIALFHDILISIGAALLFGVEFNSLLIAGVVMIIGYSINDSIVTITQISDNIRNDVEDPIKTALNSVIPRSITTSVSTLIVIVVLMASLGLSSGTGGFIVVLATGVVTGTLSSLVVVPFVIGLTDKSKNVAPKKSLEGNV